MSVCKLVCLCFYLSICCIYMYACLSVGFCLYLSCLSVCLCVGGFEKTPMPLPEGEGRVFCWPFVFTFLVCLSVCLCVGGFEKTPMPLPEGEGRVVCWPLSLPFLFVCLSVCRWLWEDSHAAAWGRGQSCLLAFVFTFLVCLSVCV